MIFLEVRNWTPATRLFSLPRFLDLVKTYTLLLCRCGCEERKGGKGIPDGQGVWYENYMECYLFLGSGGSYYYGGKKVLLYNTIALLVIFFVGEFRTDSPFFSPGLQCGEASIFNPPFLRGGKEKNPCQIFHFPHFSLPFPSSCGEREREEETSGQLCHFSS